MRGLIDEISKVDYLQTQGFPEGVTLDMDKLMVCGHSFGGVASIATAQCDDRVKVCLALDPWLMTIKNEDYQTY